MSPARAVSGLRIGALGWALIAFRLTLMALLLAICVPLHYLWRALRLERFWPRVFLAAIGAVAGLDLRVRGRARPHALLVANHVSWLDIPALAHACGAAFVAHEGLAGSVFLKWLCELNDTVFVARGRRGSVDRQVAQLRRATAGGGRVTLFAEGTTCDGTRVLPFKSALLSAAEPVPAGLAIQPVALIYDDVPDIAWVGDEPGLDNFRRVLARLRPVRLTVAFLDPLAGTELADRKTMAAAAQARIARAL